MRPIVWLTGLLAGWLIECLRLSFKGLLRSDILSGLTGRSGLFGRIGWAVLVTVVSCHGRFFDNYIQKKEKRGRQGPAEHRKMFNRYFGGHVSREDVTCV